MSQGARQDRPNPAVADLFGDVLDHHPAPSNRLIQYLPGLLVAGTAALAAAYLSEHYGAPQMLMGLLLGLAFNFTNADRRLHAGLNLASTWLLRLGIVLLGVKITVSQITGLGLPALGAIVAIVAIVCATGVLVSRLLRQGPWAGLIAGSAVAICGASAALAVAALLGPRRASQAQLTLVLVGIAAASALAMSTYPVLAGWLGMSDTQAGFMLGASVHDVAQALGAGFNFSDTAGESATIVKLTRVALLAPLLLALSLILREEGGKAGPITIPWFVLGFFAVALLNGAVAIPSVVTEAIAQAANALLLLAVVATGIRSPMQLLLDQGWRSSLPVIVATLVSLVLATLAAMMLG